VAAVTTELRLNAPVTCADGPAGRLTDVVLDPDTEHVTHLVVALHRFGDPRHLVPVTLLESSGAGGAREVRLRCSRRDLARTEFFTETETLPPEVVDPWSVAAAADGLLPWPLVSPIPSMHARVPPGEVAMRRDTPVEASDGQVGHLDALVLDSPNEPLADLIMRRGILWRQEELTIPAAAITRIDAAAIHLSVPKSRLHTLSTVPPNPAA
jgi:hypothetical protein